MGRAARALRTRVGLTGRGWGFLVTGGCLALLGLTTGLTPATQFGALVATLPVVAGLLTRGPRPSLELQRLPSARELPSGEVLNVTISVRGRFPRARSLLLEDLASPALGGAHRFAVSGLSGRAISRPHYRVRVGARGVHHLGPLRIHVVDRFGMVHRVITTGGRTEVLVTPRVVPLDPVVLGGASIGSGSGQMGARGAASDDVIPRAYAPGDEMRRIDWKASARTDSLMVRSEESPWRSTVTLVLDLRAPDHRGAEPDSSVDAALSLAASIGCLALERGWDLTVRTTDDLPVFGGSPIAGVESERHALLRALAFVPISHTSVPSMSLQHNESAASGPLILIIGAVSAPSARLLVGIGARSRQRLLVALAADQWRDGGTESGSRGGLSGARSGAARRGGASEAAAREGVQLFHEAGWQVSEMGRDTSVATAWARLVAPTVAQGASR